MADNVEESEDSKGGRPKGRKREDTIQAKLSKEEREAAEMLKTRLHLTTDSAVVQVFLQAIRGKSTSEIRAFLYPDKDDESLRLLAA